MPVIQLPLDFTPRPIAQAKPIPENLAWRDVTDIAHGAGISGDCLVSADLHDWLDDQSLYDALWTAGFTLSLGSSASARFTLALNGDLIQLKAIQTKHAVRLGRVNDF